jgi:hypothetical protein
VGLAPPASRADRFRPPLQRTFLPLVPDISSAKEVADRSTAGQWTRRALPRLTTLDLGGSLVADAGPAALAGYPNLDALRRLDLSKTDTRLAPSDAARITDAVGQSPRPPPRQPSSPPGKARGRAWMIGWTSVDLW